MDEFDEVDIPMPPKQKVKGYHDGLLRAAEIADKWSEYYRDMAKVIAPKAIEAVKQAILKEAGGE